jgi:hypothetical protein
MSLSYSGVILKLDVLDFTLKAYKEYIVTLIEQGYVFQTFAEYLQHPVTPPFCLLRHDVDRKPQNALRMAVIENNLGVKSTYYFRNKPCSWNEAIIKSISDLGHEIGYHYECLCDTNGNFSMAYDMFENGLDKLRMLAPVKTISMHGRPLSPYDSRDMWLNEELRKQKFSALDLAAEVYLDIDYSDIAYINDTGRNWMSSSSNIRDKVASTIKTDFRSRIDLLNAIKSGQHKKIVFQIHPERWTDDPFEWSGQLLKDSITNLAKVLIQVVR